MQQRSVRAYLGDILLASDAVESFVRGKTFEDYARDAQLRAAVERQVFILGEAVNRIKAQEPLAVHTLGDVHAIVGARNILAHLYFALQHDKVWNISQVHVPWLRIAAQQWLSEMPESSA